MNLNIDATKDISRATKEGTCKDQWIFLRVISDMNIKIENNKSLTSSLEPRI